MIVDVEKIGAKAGLSLPASMLDFIDLGPYAILSLRDSLREFSGRFPARTGVPLVNVKLLAPIPRPRKNIFGIGLNYVEHVRESLRRLDTAKDLPKQPVISRSRRPASLAGRGDTEPSFEESGYATDGICRHWIGIREIEAVRFPWIGHEFGLGSD